MSKKDAIVTELFEICKKKGEYVFDNELVKEICKRHRFGNPFDVTKLDNTDKLPPLLAQSDYFIHHLGEGKHQFIKGIKLGFHEFEEITAENTYTWKYRKSILNEYDTSESNILSVAFNQRIIHDFLYEDIVASPKVYNAKRTKASFTYNIGKVKVSTTNIQMEIDLTTEYNGFVTVFEGKNNFLKDFAVYQLYLPFLYYHNLKTLNKLEIKEINCCYVLRKRDEGGSMIRLYCYTFESPFDMTSIKLLKSAQYNLIKR